MENLENKVENQEYGDKHKQDIVAESHSFCAYVLACRYFVQR